MLIEKLLPNPQYRYGTNDAENKVGKIPLAKQLNVQQTADEGTGITAYNTYEEIHTTSFSFTAHNAVGNIANENTSKDWPRCEICNMF